MPEVTGLGEGMETDKEVAKSGDQRQKAQRGKEHPWGGVGDRMLSSWRAGGRDMPPRPPGLD